MSFRSFSFAAAATTFAIGFATTLPALAADITIRDAYARSAGAFAKTGAAYFQVLNPSKTDDRLMEVRSDVAKLTRLHSVQNLENGVVGMRHLSEGLLIPAGGSTVLKRGGTHVMFMGLSSAFEQGQVISVTLVFETAGEIEVDIAVDLLRKPGDAGPEAEGMNMDGMNKGNTGDADMGQADKGEHGDGTDSAQ
jgi:periplasmic copper chaperone A